MKLSLIIEALRERAPSFKSRVAGAAEFQALEPNAKMMLPAAYVIPTGDTVSRQESQTDYYQVVNEGFAVVVVLDNRRDLRGQTAAFDAVDTIRREIFLALLGWEPDESTHPIEYDGGQVVEMNRAALYYQFDFTAMRELTSDDTRHGVDLDSLEPLKTVVIDMDFIDPGDGPEGNIEHHDEIHFTE
ncbi:MULTISPECIES: phage tail terminator protein [Cronobacter]|uniref:phage tail terminator protein n=1 Tax=Cronobacter TaxID=413496 RepID=UPI0003A7FC79|nr:MULTISPECIES: hypothetical protein [Cronobacter]EJH4501839.1 hypothetical protein [Cronobacter sakazakii]EJJ0661073.1 hypothetical protein [Cronobacter sakazakii]EJJ0668038.1 hypothetical protein [Cronobacter sakazakii]EKA9348886.1 hypothetical protein [Cronobacter sakazakii]EKF2277804.1 hypothetical protein [Cronobacter dublinensis]